MRKWIPILILAMLFSAAFAEETFYTNNDDRYYHTDAHCDHNPKEGYFQADSIEIFEREIYKKYPISETAAAEFEKKACPVCVKTFEPVYLGDCLPGDAQDDVLHPWEFDSYYLRWRIDDEKLSKEVTQTHEAFYKYFEEYAEYKTGIVKRKHDYPSCYAGTYKNIQGGYTYQIVDPTNEILSAFKKLFGGGAWIVSAKYGYNEMTENCDRVFDSLTEWCKSHPEVDANPVYASIETIPNFVLIGINGRDWKQAAAAMEEIAPIYVHFAWSEQEYALYED